VGATYCFDLDDTISSTPEVLGPIMRGLRSQGHEVHVLSSVHTAQATQSDMVAKKLLLDRLGLGDAYDKLAVVDGPGKQIAVNKVRYMQDVGAKCLVDNNKANIAAARTAGFTGLRHFDPS